MRILELGKFYPPYKGGIETLQKQFCEGFVHWGAEVDCVVFNDRSGSVRERINGVNVHRLASHGTWLSLPISPGYIRAACQIKATLCHAQFPNPLADLALLLRRDSIPLVLSYHSDVVSQRLSGLFYRPLLGWLLKRADRIVVATPAHVDYSPVLGSHRHKCEVIPYGLDFSNLAMNPGRESRVQSLRSEVRGGRLAVVTVGRLVPYKGHAILMEACRSLDVELWIVGTGPLESALRQRSVEFGMGERVRFWGQADEEKLGDIIHASDIFVLPSVTRAEAFGLVQVEAMAAGKPVVNTSLQSGVPMVSLDGVTGLTVPPGDAAALNTAIRRLSGDKALRLRLGMAGRERALAEFGSERMVERYWRCIEGLIQKGGSGPAR